jgi:hypothetical protein
MVVQIIDVECVAVRKVEDHSPIGAYRYRPKAFELAFERMQPETRHIHIGHCAGRAEPRENIAQLTTCSAITPRGSSSS